MRKDSIVAVTVATYATIYIEADSVEEAVAYAEEHCEELVSDSDFEDGGVQVDSWENYTTELEPWMDKIYTEDGVKTYDEYLDELEEQEEDS